MRLDFALAAAYGKQHLGNPVADVVFDKISEEQQADQHTGTRKNQVLNVVAKA